jgi:demethylmenaquinone methyltransferase/2-methoxy-6-polyprenyl-1,4-benzoquinol methylase
MLAGVVAGALPAALNAACFMTLTPEQDSPPHGVLPPHVPLTDYYADEPARHRFVRHIFDDTASDYDRIEKVLALGSGPWYRGRALRRAHLQPGAQVLDVGIGTGLVAREALKIIGPNGRLVGVDPSPGMMGQVHLPGVSLLQGRAEALPCADASCDFVSMGYALRHLSDLSAAFTEFHRVLRPGGRLLMLEITRPQKPWALFALKTYMRAVVPTVARVVARQNKTSELWRYYWDTIEACVPPEAVLEALRAAGFKRVRRYAELGVFSEYTAFKPRQSST